MTFAEQPDTQLVDPAFSPLPGATAEFGHLGGSVYKIEVPEAWNGRLVVWMHGFDSFASEVQASPPDFRRYLIAHGYAWAASSYSTSSFIPGRGADETAALWDFFVREHGRPTWTYAAGLSMGGWSAGIAAERYGNRYDGALSLCGAVGVDPGFWIPIRAVAAGAFVAGVSQAQYDADPDPARLIDEHIRPALGEPALRSEFDRLMVSLTGGPRAFAVEGLRMEEETNFERAQLLITAGLVPSRLGPYPLDGPNPPVSEWVFNRRALRFDGNDEAITQFTAGMEMTGDLTMPLISLHSTGDGQVPVDQALALRDRVAAAGRSDLLVQRIIEDPNHCGFSTAEQEDALEALVAWVEQGVRPEGTDLSNADLEHLDATFELTKRDSTTGGDGQVGLRGTAKLDGQPFDARWLGAVVLHDGLITPCNVTLPPIDGGDYEISVFTARASAGCGEPDSRVIFWTFVNDTKVYSTNSWPWSDVENGRFDAEFSSALPQGAAPRVAEFSGEIYDTNGQQYDSGARVEALIGDTVCGVASLRGSGFYILSVVGPDSIPTCAENETIRFRVDGSFATEKASFADTPLDLTVSRG